MNNLKVFLKDFIENCLEIKDYDIKFLNSGKDNITSIVTLENKDIIVQLMGGISQGQINIIKRFGEVLENEPINIANKVYPYRIYNYNGRNFQVMEKINGENKTYEDLSLKELKNVIKYVAKYHNIVEKYNFSEFQNKTNNFKNVYYYFNLAYNFVKQSGKYQYKFNELLTMLGAIKVHNGLRKGCLHGDISLKNILIRDDGDYGLIDYEMITYDDLLFDLVDHFRNYMKYDKFGKKEYFALLSSYEEIRPLTKKERDALFDYQKSIILNTGIRYFLSLFEGSGFNNFTENMGSTIEKVDRCIMEYKKTESFFNK